jgi:hypothetical protein
VPLAAGHFYGVDTRNSQQGGNQDDDLLLGAKIGRACYEMYK